MPENGYAAAIIRAEKAFALAEAQGKWSEWPLSPEIPPWWIAGAEYVFEIMKGRTEDALAAQEHPDRIRFMWEVLIQAEASHIWARIRLYGNSESRRGQRRQKAVEFAQYVQQNIQPRLLALLDATAHQFLNGTP